MFTPETLPSILYAGSVKNVRGPWAFPSSGQEAPHEALMFEFSDRYSIFDWGAMPDELPKKGEALAALAFGFFHLLEKRLHLSHHCQGWVETHPGEKRGLVVKAVDVLRPSFSKGGWDYGVYKDRPVNALVPLEIIFRFGVPSGSSLLTRTHDPSYRLELGLLRVPEEGDRFDFPVIEFSSKLETTDRYLDSHQAMAMAGLTPREMSKLKSLTTAIALELKDIFEDMGVELWDGKIELAFVPGPFLSERDFMLVDSIGPDELRLIYRGAHLSKEGLRQHYRGSEWCQALAKAKKIASDLGVKDWKKICVEELGATPTPLPAPVKEAFSMLYPSLANALFAVHLPAFPAPFPGAWPLDRLCAAMEKGIAP